MRSVTVVLRSGIVAVFAVSASSCDFPSLKPAPSPKALADSLIFAAREFCVPYVVDGSSIASLVKRPGVSERHLNVRGVAVTRYVLDQPGSPAVTLSQSESPHDYCAIWMEFVRSTDQHATVKLFASDLRLGTRVISKPHKVPTPGVLDTDHDSYVACIHGQNTALITVSNPPESDGVSIEVHVISDPVINRSAGCAS